MAIDTARRRKSAAGVPFLPLGPGVTPDATAPVAWRWSAGWSYSGVAVESGGLVCATVVLSARVSATVVLSARVSATVALSARVSATAGLREC